MSSFNPPRPATPYPRMLETDDEELCQSNCCEASFTISFDSFHDALAGHEPFASALPPVSPGADFWRPQFSTLSDSSCSGDSDVERAPPLRRVGNLSISLTGSADSKMCVTVGNADIDVAFQRAQGVRPGSQDYQNTTSSRCSDSSTNGLCSTSTTTSLVSTSQMFSGTWDFITTPRSLNRKKKQENLRLEYHSSQINDSDSVSDLSSHETASFDFANQMTLTKTNPHTTIPAKDSAIWHPILCICGCSSHPAHGQWTECVACDQWYHLRCVGVEHLNEHYKNKPFYCPRCMEIGVVEEEVDEWN